jgi:imidazolonepropionase-like amidohydrolase
MQAYRADAVFDGERMITDASVVLVADGRILGVEPTAPEGCPVVDLPGTTALPGLIDAHVHLCADSGPRALDQLGELDDDRLAAIIDAACAVQLAAGVTTVRDLGDIGYAALARRGDPHAPTILASGPPITSIGGHCATMGGEAAGINGLRHAVRERAERGVDVVKVMTSGGVMTPGTDIAACQFSLDEVRAVVAEAHDLGLPVTGHAHALAAVEMCVDAGVNGIEHCTCMTADGIRTPPELVERIARAGILVCPTIGVAPGVGLPPHVKAVMDRMKFSPAARVVQTGEFHRGGIRLVSGTDGGINTGKPHGILAESLIDLGTAGVPVDEVLASATGRAARDLGLGARKGVLRAGFDADVTFVDGNPMHDLTALRSVRQVVLGGRPLVPTAA